MQLHPEYRWAIARRGEAYRLMGRYDEAIADLSRAIELDPSDDDYTAEHAAILRLIGKDEEGDLHGLT
jgi:tetratricopeptide (TPR) repeat protein